MGIKFQILKLLKENENGLTVNELSKLLNKENKESIRMILNRDLIQKGLAIELKEKRDGSKVYKEKSEENESETSVICKELLQKNLDTNVSLMKYFQELKNTFDNSPKIQSKIQETAFKKQEIFKKAIETIDKTKEVIGDDNK